MQNEPGHIKFLLDWRYCRPNRTKQIFTTTAANSSGRVGLVRYTSAPIAHQLVKQLRQLDTSNAQFIALTGYGQRKDKDRELAAGFDVQLPKLVNPQVMLETPYATPVAIGKN